MPRDCRHRLLFQTPATDIIALFIGGCGESSPLDGAPHLRPRERGAKEEEKGQEEEKE